jgi:choloylglycine hydrolase
METRVVGPSAPDPRAVCSRAIRRLLVVSAAALLLAAGCSTASDPTTGAQAGAPPSPIASGSSRQSAEQVAASLGSLRKVDELPLYTMTYAGGYDRLRGIQPTPRSTRPFGCSLFVASGNPARPMFARNFDWDKHPALLLFTDPPDGYASVSMVDISYLGISGANLLSSPPEQHKLLEAPLLPFDGMNEHGLAIGLAADQSADATGDPAKPTVGGVRVMRLILDKARTVDEALSVFRSYNLDFTGGPPLHYLVADATGGSAVVEYVDGSLVVTRGGPPWQALTNFRLAGSGEATRSGDWRYRTARSALDRAAGVLSWDQGLRLLHAVAQPHTRWSVTYGLRTGEVHLVADQHWSTVYDFHQRLA